MSCCGAEGAGIKPTGIFILLGNHERISARTSRNHFLDCGVVPWKRETGGSAYFSLECMCIGPRLGKGVVAMGFMFRVWVQKSSKCPKINRLREPTKITPVSYVQPYYRGIPSTGSQSKEGLTS